MNEEPIENKIAFLDRDGVLNVDFGHVGTEDRLVLYRDSFDGLKLLTKLSYQLVVITNQSGIARGLYSENQFHFLMSKIFELYAEEDIQFLAYYFCPHHPDFGRTTPELVCECRKPKPGLILSALDAHDVNASQCIMIGDRDTDVSCAKAAGVERAYKINRINNEENDRSFVNLIEEKLDEICL